MNLPEIPDEAWNAAHDGLHGEVGFGFIRPVLTAAWPHLYAAALRYAAERYTAAEVYGLDPDPCALLNGWADEATS